MSRTPTERERRLAEALRANLRRRKGQARERAGAAGDAGEDGEASPAGGEPDSPD